MFTVTYLNMAIYTVALIAGVYFIVETRVRDAIKKNNTMVSLFLVNKDEKLQKALNSMVDGIFESVQQQIEEHVENKSENK